MENNYSNYDMLDKLIANNKKAKSWTAFWVIILCLMSAAILWMAFTVSEKNKKINQQVQVIQSNKEILEMKSRIIDSLTENCNVAKTEIIKDYDSVIVETQKALAIVNAETQPGNNIQISAVQQKQLKDANTSIKRIKTNIAITKLEIKKENTRLFVQYNNAEDEARIKRLLYLLNSKIDYVIAPPEYIDKFFPTVVKFYNFQNKDEEMLIREMIGKNFNISPGDIQVRYEENEKIKPTVEIWLGTRSPERNLKNLPLKKIN